MQASILLLTSICFVSCKARQDIANIKVTDSNLVAYPEQALGVYGIDKSQDRSIRGNATVVAVGRNAFITNAHVIKSLMQNDAKVYIKDWQGRTVVSFFPQDRNVLALVHPDNASTSPWPVNDLGAIIFEKPLENLPHGIANISNRTAKAGDKVYLVGNGKADYRVSDPDDVKFKDPAFASGLLRWGTNTIAKVTAGGAFINGFAFETPDETGGSVSSHGDSGGGVFFIDENETKHFYGLMAGGLMFSTDMDGQVKYYNEDQNPHGISDQKNIAFSFIIDIRQHELFFQQIASYGGEIAYFGESNQAKDPKFLFIPMEIAPPPTP